MKNNKNMNNEPILQTIKVKSLNFILKKDDLTTQDTDIIVNAANSQLWMGGGVAGAIYAKGGQSIQNDCHDRIKENNNMEFENGDVVVTGCGKMKLYNKNNKHIFHAVGPIYRGGYYGEKEELAKCFRNCFEKANNLGYSISIPPISSGIFGYPKDECAEIFFDELHNFVKNTKEIKCPEIRLIIIDYQTYSVFSKVFFYRKDAIENLEKENSNKFDIENNNNNQHSIIDVIKNETNDIQINNEKQNIESENVEKNININEYNNSDLINNNSLDGNKNQSIKDVENNYCKDIDLFNNQNIDSDKHIEKMQLNSNQVVNSLKVDENIDVNIKVIDEFAKNIQLSKNIQDN